MLQVSLALGERCDHPSGRVRSCIPLFPAQEDTATLAFTREPLYKMAPDSEGQMTEEIAPRLRGLQGRGRKTVQRGVNA